MPGVLFRVDAPALADLCGGKRPAQVAGAVLSSLLCEAGCQLACISTRSHLIVSRYSTSRAGLSKSLSDKVSSRVSLRYSQLRSLFQMQSAQKTLFSDEVSEKSVSNAVSSRSLSQVKSAQRVSPKCSQFKSLSDSVLTPSHAVQMHASSFLLLSSPPPCRARMANCACLPAATEAGRLPRPGDPCPRSVHPRH